MVRLTVSTEEYLMLNDNIKIVFLGEGQRTISVFWWTPGRM